MGNRERAFREAAGWQAQEQSKTAKQERIEKSLGLGNFLSNEIPKAWESLPDEVKAEWGTKIEKDVSDTVAEAEKNGSLEKALRWAVDKGMLPVELMTILLTLFVITGCKEKGVETGDVKDIPRKAATMQKIEGGRVTEGTIEIKELTPEQKTEQITKQLNNRFSFNSNEITDLLEYEEDGLDQSLARAKEDLTQVNYNDLMLLFREASTFRTFPLGSATPGSTTFRPEIAKELHRRGEACRVYQAAIIKNFCAAKSGQPGLMDNVEFLKGQWWSITKEAAEAIRAGKIMDRGEQATVQAETSWREAKLIGRMMSGKKNIFQDDNLWSGLSLEEKKILAQELKTLTDFYAESAWFRSEGIDRDLSDLADKIEASNE